MQWSGKLRASLSWLPGLRGGWDVGAAQAIVGVAAPVQFGSGDAQASVFAYFSYELPFAR